MRYFVFLSLVLLVGVFAQAENDAWMAAGCGPDGTQFNVKTEKTGNTPQPDPGKAVVYVFSKEIYEGIRIGKVTTRVGMDGSWVGANQGASYVAFSADPGEHRLCANWQSSIGTLAKKASAISLTAEPGHTYFFQTIIEERSHKQTGIRLEAVDPAEGQLLLVSSTRSIAEPKK